MIIRWDKEGQDATHSEIGWTTDCEVRLTQYAHPDYISGLHTNGPMSIWIRSVGGDWIFCSERHLHEVHRNWIDMGIEWFKAVEHEKVEA